MITGRLSVVALIALALIIAGPGCSISEVRTVEGLVVDVTGTSPSDIQAFSLRRADGAVFRFEAGDVGFGHGGFPAAHLREHLALADPVRVTYRTEGDRLITVRLEDVET